MNHKEFAVGLARKAGAIIRQNFSLGIAKDWKEDNTPVTVTDLEINKLVIEAAEEYFPTYSIIGEEQSKEIPGSEYAWLCDPIDGTIPFSHGIPTSTFSLALTRDGEPILGVIYDPFLDRMAVAEKGSGAFLSGELMTVSKDTSLANSVASITFRKKNLGFIEVQRELMSQGVSLINLRSFIYTGMLVAAGELSAAFFTEDMPWDAAALKIIVEEAGGKATDLAGNDQRYDRPINGILVSNGHVHDEIITLINRTLGN